MPAAMAGFFFSYSISSEYHMGRVSRPNFFEGIRVQVTWNERENFCNVREKLDKFSTFGDLGEFLEILGGRGARPRGLKPDSFCCGYCTAHPCPFKTPLGLKSRHI
jgi:hypothetical protein